MKFSRFRFDMVSNIQHLNTFLCFCQALFPLFKIFFKALFSFYIAFGYLRQLDYLTIFQAICQDVFQTFFEVFRAHFRADSLRFFVEICHCFPTACL